MRESRLFSTLPYLDRMEWADGIEVLDGRDLSPLESVRRIRAAAARYPVLVLDGTARSEQVAAAIIARMRRPPPLIMTDATWKRGSSLPDRIACAAGMRAMRGPHITFCVLSSWELERFPRTWGVPAEQVRFTPFCCTLSERELELPVSDDGGVFAGGDSLRDYRTLLDAASGIDAKVTIASVRLGRLASAPANVSIGKVTPQEFAELNRGAAVVVVPLADSSDRSAGQQTYLNAMALGKPVVVTDAPGVRDYVEDCRTGLIVPVGDPGAMAAAVRRLLDPANKAEVDRMRRSARETVLSRFTRRNYIASIRNVVEEQPRRSVSVNRQGRSGAQRDATRG
jgi:hypothetical protein